MTHKEASIWLLNLAADIGKVEHQSLWHYEQAVSEIREMLEREPDRKNGQWLDGVLPNDNGGLPVIVCDQCNTFYPLTFGASHNYCPSCGSDMREGEALKVAEIIKEAKRE